MHVTKKTVLLLLCSLSFAGCSTASDAPQAAGNTTQTGAAGSEDSVKKTAGSVIVVFNAGITYDDASLIAQEHDFWVSHFYETLSQQNGKIYMTLDSGLMSAEKMQRQLEKDPRIESVSANYQRKLQ